VVRADAALDAAALTPRFEGADVVVHAAGMTRGTDAAALHTVNQEGTRAVVEAVNATGARLIFVSSQAASGPGTRSRPAREDDQPRPVTAYGRSKLAAEQVVGSAARVPWTIVRPASVYGPRDRQFLPLFRFASRGIFPDVAAPDAAFTLVHVADVARGILLAAEAPVSSASGRTLFIGHPHAPGSNEVLSALADVFGRPFRPMRVPVLVLRALATCGDLAWLVGRQPMLDSVRLAELRSEGFVCAVDRARETIGFSAMIPLESGLEQTARWYHESGWMRRR
jgi:nucleoside-diphosphate-sugar epimerase